MKKIGRNDPCPCGSGKKFKHCHLGREDELALNGMGDISMEMSEKITGLPSVHYGRSQEMLEALDIKKLTGSEIGIKFVDLKQYGDLDVSGRRPSHEGKDGAGGVVVNVLKTKKSDPDHIYVAISPKIGDSTLVHQLAHILDYLGGSGLMPGVTKALSFDLGIPPEHLEHPQEFGYWLIHLQEEFDVKLDADDAIISYLYKNGMLIKGEDIERQERVILKSKSDRILRFLGEKSAEIDALICELPGYIGSRVRKN
jgi:SEC-C motif-containing protein